MNTQQLKQKLLELAESIEDVDEELEEVKKKFPVGGRVKFEYMSDSFKADIFKIERLQDGLIYIFGGILEGWLPVSRCQLIKPEPTWPDWIKDGTWLYFGMMGNWCITDIKPTWKNSYFISSPACQSSYQLTYITDFTNTTLEDFNIPDVPPEKRCWCKGGEK